MIRRDMGPQSATGLHASSTSWTVYTVIFGLNELVSLDNKVKSAAFLVNVYAHMNAHVNTQKMTKKEYYFKAYLGAMAR